MQDSSDRRAEVSAGKKRKAAENKEHRASQKSKDYDEDDPSTWKVAQLTSHLKEHKVPSSGVKTALIQRVREHRSGLARGRVGEKSVREDSGGVGAGGDGEGDGGRD